MNGKRKPVLEGTGFLVYIMHIRKYYSATSRMLPE